MEFLQYFPSPSPQRLEVFAEVGFQHFRVQVGLLVEDGQDGVLEGLTGECVALGEDGAEGHMEDLTTFVLVEKDLFQLVIA